MRALDNKNTLITILQQKQIENINFEPLCHCFRFSLHTCTILASPSLLERDYFYGEELSYWPGNFEHIGIAP